MTCKEKSSSPEWTGCMAGRHRRSPPPCTHPTSIYTLYPTSALSATREKLHRATRLPSLLFLRYVLSLIFIVRNNVRVCSTAACLVALVRRFVARLVDIDVVPRRAVISGSSCPNVE